MNSHEVFIHILQGCFAGTGAIVRLPQCQWSKPDGYGKISQCITTTKHSKAKTMCIFLGIYCRTFNQVVWEARLIFSPVLAPHLGSLRLAYMNSLSMDLSDIFIAHFSESDTDEVTHAVGLHISLAEPSNCQVSIMKIRGKRCLTMIYFVNHSKPVRRQKTNVSLDKRLGSRLIAILGIYGTQAEWDRQFHYMWAPSYLKIVEIAIITCHLHVLVIYFYIL